MVRYVYYRPRNRKKSQHAVTSYGNNYDTFMNGLFFRIYLTTSRTSRKLFRLLTMQTDFEHFMSDVLQASKKTGSVHKTDSFEI